ncbi:nucleotidyltransferase domain-containing protein [Candidatus Bipolaricaulota bacterium]|nr:nucleotidyltransferase domain-containing protein [Candidatus Bipolaricaulota bacterium]
MTGFPTVPVSGMILPNMGSTTTAASLGLAEALFSPVQRKVLGLLFGQPERVFQSAELIRLAASGTGAVHRQLRRLEDAGWVSVSRVGNQKHYRANRDCPAFDELRGLIVKTVGLVEPIRQALEALSSKISVAFVYGSIAKGEARAESDVDLLIVSATLGLADVYERLQDAETTLGRTVNPNILTLEEWKKKRQVPDSFVARIASQPKLFVLGDAHELG